MTNFILKFVFVLFLIKFYNIESKNILKNSTEIILSNSKELKKFSNDQNKIESNKTELMSKSSEARETKWSYFYMGQWTWHFPLWFLLYFVFYLVFCTIRSIYKHKFVSEKI